MAESLGMVNTDMTKDNLLAGGAPRAELPIVVLSGSGSLARGTVLGKITKGAGTIAADAGNTGNGVAGAVTLGKKAKVGVYTLICTAKVTNKGTFAVYDPDGYRMKDLVATEAYDNGHFALTIADGATDFEVNDKFTLTVAAGSGKYKPYDDDNTDGSDVARVILGRAVDATSADVKAFGYIGGEYNRAALTGNDTAGEADLLAVGTVVKTIG